MAASTFFDNFSGRSNLEIIRDAVAATPDLTTSLANAHFDTPVRTIKGYACNVKSLWGNGHTLLGNAGEFLDPVISSGVTIALRSASLAAPLVSSQLKGQLVDWDAEMLNHLN